MTCLLLVDLQNDFMPGGALGVPRGNEVIATANRLAAGFDHVVASQDWHPSDHGSFASQHPGREPGEVIELAGIEQVLWPDHCVQGSFGSEFHEHLDRNQVDAVFRKGTDPRLDSYSAFFDNARRRSTGLAEHLAARGVEELWLLGLASDYCVKFSALDAVSVGLRTLVVEEGCRGIDLSPGDVARAWDEMRAAGVKVVSEASVR